MGIKRDVIDLGFRMFGATGLHRLAARYTRGLGAILMFHRVRPSSRERFAPNGGLEITPGFLDQLLTRLKAEGYSIVSLDEAVARIGAAIRRADLRRRLPGHGGCRVADPGEARRALYGLRHHGLRRPHGAHVVG